MERRGEDWVYEYFEACGAFDSLSSGPDTVRTEMFYCTSDCQNDFLHGEVAADAKSSSIAQKGFTDVTSKLNLSQMSNDFDVYIFDWACEMSQQVPFLWEEKPGKPKDAARKSKSLIERDFEPYPWVSGCKDTNSLKPTVKELIINGEKIMPLKLPPRLQHLGSERSYFLSSSDCYQFDPFSESPSSSLEGKQLGKAKCLWQHHISPAKIIPTRDATLSTFHARNKDAPPKIRGSRSGPLIGAFAKPTRKHSQMDYHIELLRAQVLARRNGLEKVLPEFCPSPKEHCIQKVEEHGTYENYTKACEKSSNYAHQVINHRKVNQESPRGNNYRAKYSESMHQRKNAIKKLHSIQHQLKLAERRARFPVDELQYCRSNMHKQTDEIQRKASLPKRYGLRMCGGSFDLIPAAICNPEPLMHLIGSSSRPISSTPLC